VKSSDACEALKNKKCIELRYSGKLRVVEIHAVGYTKDNNPIMRIWQVREVNAGSSPSWKLLRLDEVESARVVEEESKAPRPGYKRGDPAMQRILCQV
jgi:hypothetical protein